MHYLRKDGRFHYTNTPKHNQQYATPLVTDSHIHFLALGNYLLTPSLRGKSLQEIEQVVRDQLDRSPEQVVLRGWHDGHAKPTGAWLNQISTEIPICLVRYCGHAAVVNRKVFDTVDFSGVEHFVDRNPGMVFEDAVGRITTQYWQIVNLQEITAKAEAYLLHRGYGYIHSDDHSYWYPMDLPYDNLKLQTYATIRVTSLNQFQRYWNEGVFERFSSVKMQIDGSFGGHTALLSHPYSDADTHGKQLWEKHDIEQLLQWCDDRQLHLCAHAIGDQALELMLQALETVHPVRLHRLIHGDYVRDDQMERLSNLPVMVDTQPAFSVTDKELLQQRIGRNSNLMYRIPLLRSHGIPLLFSSDGPVELPDWQRDAKILERMNVPLDYILTALTFAAAAIDKFERETYDSGNFLLFGENPFDRLTPPQVFMDGKPL